MPRIMSVKKEQPKVFEYFKTSEVTINGRFKEYVDKMRVQNTIQESMARRLLDLYAKMQLLSGCELIGGFQMTELEMIQSVLFS